MYSVRLYKPTSTTISLKKKNPSCEIFMLCKTNEYITGCFQLSFDSFEVSVNISSMNNKFAASKSEICVIHRQRSLKKKCLSLYMYFLLLLLLSLVSTGALQYLIMMKRYNNNNNNNHLPHVCRCAFIFGDYHLPKKRKERKRKKRELIIWAIVVKENYTFSSHLLILTIAEAHGFFSLFFLNVTIYLTE